MWLGKVVVKIKSRMSGRTKSGRRNVIDRASRTGISGSEVATSQRKEEVVPEVVIDARNRSNDPPNENCLSGLWQLGRLKSFATGLSLAAYLRHRTLYRVTRQCGIAHAPT